MSDIEAHPKDGSRRHKETFHIRIDRTEYEVHQEYMTGLQLRRVPQPAIGPDRDLFDATLITAAPGRSFM
jgi:hypothetical protein